MSPKERFDRSRKPALKKPATKIEPAKSAHSTFVSQASYDPGTKTSTAPMVDYRTTTPVQLEALVGRYENVVIILRIKATEQIPSAKGVYHARRKPLPAKTLATVIKRLASYGIREDDIVVISGIPSDPELPPSGLMN